MTGLLIGLLVATLLPDAPMPARAAVRRGRSIEVFYQRDLVLLVGYPARARVRVDVLRKGFVIGTKTQRITRGGTLEINHVGAEANDCWSRPTTPDIIPGDRIRTRVIGARRNPTDSTTTRDIGIEFRAIRFNVRRRRITVRGHARSHDGARIVPGRDVLEFRMNKVNRDNPWGRGAEGRRDLRHDVGRNVDPRTGNFTHVFRRLRREDVRDARANGVDQILEWSPDIGEVEPVPMITVFDAGEGLPAGCSPHARGASRPDLARRNDSGRARGDNITKRSRLTFAGLTGEAGGNATVKLFVDGKLRRTTSASERVYRFRNVNLGRGRHFLTAVEIPARGGPPSNPSVALKLVVDKRKPFARRLRVRPNPFDYSRFRATAISFRLREPARVKTRLVRRGRSIRRFPNRDVRRARRMRLLWNGKTLVSRSRVPFGDYRVKVKTTDVAGNRAVRAETIHFRP
ncbi:MAG: hypothetical protein M3124_08790 [Actinomycetota bacterium]|nr:hypothetical protein [Actinomycetota bacterium]